MGLLVILVLFVIGVCLFFWLFVVVFNLVGVGDFFLDYWHVVNSGMFEYVGILGVVYVIFVFYVLILMIMYGVVI